MKIVRCAAVAVLTSAVATSTLLAQDEKNPLETCEKPIGTLAVVEPQNEYIIALQRYSLASPVSLIRMMVQKSNCFIVVERGAAMNNMKQERALAGEGEMQEGENMGKGLMKAAEFILTPAVLISAPTGGIGGGSLLPGRLGAVVGGLRFKEAQTSILIADARTTVQVLAAEGKGKKTDFALGGFLGVGAAGGYSSTPEGKLIAKSYLDNMNKIITDAKANPDLMARAAKYKATGLSGADLKVLSFPDGAVLAPKIDNVALRATASDAAKLVVMLKKTDELVFLGEEEGTYVKVQGSNGEGWVKKSLVAKK